MNFFGAETGKNLITPPRHIRHPDLVEYLCLARGGRDRANRRSLCKHFLNFFDLRCVPPQQGEETEGIFIVDT